MTVVHPNPTVASADSIAEVDAAPLDHIDGVTNRVLWQDASSMAGVLAIEAGHALGEHAHRWNHHHIWVVSGNARIAGASLGPGSYVHIPVGVLHDIAAGEEEPCVVFYVYERPA